jgi:D-tagatose-1,6-bisphosphate aldolase subunit GatZ/KbaZ
VLLAEPKYRQNYYPGDEATRAYKRKYSFSDRSCCYWPNPQITAA